MNIFNSAPNPGCWVWNCRCSAAQSYPTLCDPTDCSTPGLPVPHRLLEFAQTHVPESMMPSDRLTLRCHFLLPPSVSSQQVAKVLELQLQPRSGGPCRRHHFLLPPNLIRETGDAPHVPPQVSFLCPLPLPLSLSSVLQWTSSPSVWEHLYLASGCPLVGCRALKLSPKSPYFPPVFYPSALEDESLNQRRAWYSSSPGSSQMSPFRSQHIYFKFPRSLISSFISKPILAS